MSQNKSPQKVLLSIALVFLFAVANFAFAETKVFIEEYTYQASEADSKLSSRVIAREQVKRKLLEKLGTYLESETEVKNFQLTKDQIIILTAGIVSAETIEEKWDGKTYFLKEKMAVDPNEVYKSIDNLRQDRQETKKLEETRKKAEGLLREVEKLKKELELAKKDQGKIDRYDEAIKELSATDWYLKGISLIRAGYYDKAITANTRAIQLNPQYTAAYLNRSFAYSNLGNYRQTLEDSNKAIELDPKLSMAYVNRSLGYSKSGKLQEALADLNKAIELDPQNSIAYASRSFAYSSLGKYQEALEDADRAIALDPRIAGAYVNRGFAYGYLGNWQKVIENSNKAIELDLRNALAYVNRGFAYSKLGNHRPAFEDASKAIELDPKLAVAYANRGDAYWNLGNIEGAIRDYKTAAGLGHEKAQEALKNLEKQQTRTIEGTEAKDFYERNLRIFQKGDYINYKLTGFVNTGGGDLPILGTAQYRVTDETQVDYFGNQCKVIRFSLDFTVVGKDQSFKAKRVSDGYFTQDTNGSLMIHGGKDSEKGLSWFVKTPSTGRYLASKSPLNAHESVSQNIELTNGSSRNTTDMVLSEEQVSVPAGVFKGFKTISNTLLTKADSSKDRSIETNWIVPGIGPVRANCEYSSEKESMKLILEMTDTNIPYKK